MTNTNEFYFALLRPAVLQIIRSVGYQYAKPSVIDSLTDLAVKYLVLVSRTTAQTAFQIHHDYTPTVQDVRLALTEIGALRPQMSTTEEAAHGYVELNGQMVPFEDLRGVENFILWAQSRENKEIRRVAGFGNDDSDNVNEIAAGLDAGDGDYLTALKKKHSKTGEESRYQGTILGKDAEITSVAIAGGLPSISAWRRAQTTKARGGIGETTRQNDEEEDEDDETEGSVLSSVPDSPDVEKTGTTAPG